MELREVTEQEVWDGFVGMQPWASFPQSWNWGVFQEREGHWVRRFFLVDGEEILLSCQLLRHERGLFGYWFAPRGPVFAETLGERRKEAFEALRELLRERGLPGRSLFWRFEPMCSSQAGQGLFPLTMQRRHSINPSTTDLLDLSKTEEELLAAMHQKTRYNIRLAAKHGVVVREGTGEDMATFLALMRDTSGRDAFQAHDEAYLQATFDALAESGFVRLRLAEIDGIALAANMEIYFGDTATYLHGASSSENRQLMAPFLLQWEAMVAAKQEGKRWYDFWGSNPSSKAGFDFKPTWEGITRFKRGFGAEERQLAGTWDLPIHPWVYLLKYGGKWK